MTTEKTKTNSPDFNELRKILQTDLKRKVSDVEARKIGRWLLGFYSHLSDK